MLASDSRASPFSMDHDILLVLLQRKVRQKGLRPVNIIQDRSSPAPTFDRLRAMQNPYPSVMRILQRLERDGLCLRRGELWFPADRGRVVKGQKAVVYEGAAKVLRHFLRCPEYNCDRDHFPDFILSDYAFDLVPRSALGPPIYRLLAKAIVWEASRSGDVRADLADWLEDMVRNATRRGVKPRDFPKFRQLVTAAVLELEGILRQGTLEDRVNRVGNWLLAEPRLFYIFMPRLDARNLVRWATAASPTFWRYGFSGAPLRESDFAPVHLRTFEVDTVRLRGFTVTRGSLKLFSQRVRLTALSLITIWLRHDIEHFPRTASRLRDIGAGIEIRQGFGKETGVRFRVTQRRKA